ncbi:hypothetical protein Q73A0000_14245 [Kaistella flava (ex Peng et al. 2021)]|uniref:Gliding motility protein n=1 Tax=Kaistella flava (ex Peng et al. 2021) TaxID=2038776 RepID=A0A7M2YDA3_9FLAO|nr:hypothetical protein [Kaistella flava (ex Peng et al. 2021)]QOW11442.1 hypothetical protein Q73A0000_14245 [Kaistella flava (ex Peng et al. 2021)]
MKKIILSTALFFLMYSKTEACAWYDPDNGYFNLFTQTIIKDKTYLPFLHTLSNRFYGHEHYEIPSENIESWQKYFGNSLSYLETQILVEKMPMKELNDFKKGLAGNSILKKLGSYQKYQEAIDYLIEAKYLEPYMRINYVESPDSFYFYGDKNAENATQLDYEKTISALTSLYNAAKIPEIKLRYAYQLVRFNHYTRHYEESTEAFKKYVEPLQLKSAPYFMALDQLAGAQRGLNKSQEANWNFFQVFMKSKNRKESAFVSMQLSDSASFDNILKRAQSKEEKNMAYFLLAYQDFSNPIPMMEKMYDIDPNSEILKVLAARSINELERSYLPIYFNNDDKDNSTVNSIGKSSTVPKAKTETSGEVSFWQKIKNFFIHLFSSEEGTTPEKATDESDKNLLNNPNRLPFYTKNENYGPPENSPKNFIDDFEKLTSKIKEKSDDEFWQIADAYLSFLKKDYDKSKQTLTQIKTTNPEYITEINRMKMLNDTVSQPKITAEYEDYLVKTYPEIFANLPLTSGHLYNGESQPSTQQFIQDILANRYFIQGEEGKSFLMSNRLSDLQYNPNSKLIKSVDDFYRKPNKTTLEQNIISKNIDDVGNIDAFFNVLYGDREMRLANFEKAKGFYEKATDFGGIPREEYSWNESDTPTVTKTKYGNNYNGFKNISSLIFGHNVWESFNSPENESMKSENFTGFPFIKNGMNKVELAEALIQLKKIGLGTDEKSAEANQLIGNLLYNTSSLGYFREVFVMDINNDNGPKYHFYNNDQPVFKYYYKNFADDSFVEPDNFDLAINYYQKALNQSKDEEQKARILFQMASSEQGRYYQYETKAPFDLNYGDPDYDKKQADYMKQMDLAKNQKYRTYFTELKKNYNHTQTSKSLQGSCSYYDYFMKRN